MARKLLNRLSPSILAIVVSGWLLGSIGRVEAAPPKVISSAPAPEIDKLVYRTDGWVGGDGAYSVQLPSKRIVWLFSDTWVGKVQSGQRAEVTMVNNTIGVQPEPGKPLEYFIGRSADGKPKAMITPPDGRGWYWLQSAVSDGPRLSLFLNHVEKTSDPGVFGFRSVGLWLGTVNDAEQRPSEWNVTQVKMPNAIFTSDRTLVWGASTVRIGDLLYVYGTDEHRGQGAQKRHLVVARVPVSSLSDFSIWRYYRDGNWVEDFHEPSHLAGNMATEYSVTPFEKGYLVVYTDNGFSPKIMGRTADEPWGPWSQPVALHTCPEMGRDKNLFCYGAKVHPALSSDHDIVLCYFVNSFDFWQVVREADLYWPRFVRVKLASSAD